MENSIKVTVTVNAPVERVWDTFMNPDHLKQWLTGFVSVEHLSGSAGQKGSTSKLILEEHGKELEVMEQVLDVIPMKQYTFNMVHDSLETLTDVRFISIGNVTEIIQAVRFSPQGLFMKLMMPLLRVTFKRRMANDLRKLKIFVEKTP